MNYKFLLLCLVVSSLVACHSVTVRPEGITKRIDRPDYEEQKDFFLFGLVNEHAVDVRPICKSGGIDQMQAQSTFVDSLLTAVTLGIYTPRSVRVWCHK